MKEEPSMRATCAGMVPGEGISEEERRRRDLSYKPKSVRKRSPYAEEKCAARAALDQPCWRIATVIIDNVPLCHQHARQTYDRTC